MLVRRTTPYRDLTQLRSQMDDLFNRSFLGLFDAGDGGASMSNWTPVLDVIENEDNILLRAELPGLSQEDVEITVENSTLSLKGDKRAEHSEDNGHYRRIESRHGAFYRSFSLPSAVDQDKIDARFANGVLEITLPKAEKAKPKKIAVKVN